MSWEIGKKMIKVGPAGFISSQSDEYWDDKGFSDIHEIYVSHGEKIHSLQFQYVHDATNLLLSDPHGLANGPKFNLIRLDYPSEFVTGISGHYQPGSGGRVCSLTFTTNKGSYGPFGRPLNVPNNFEFQLGDGRNFGGFYGHVDRGFNSVSAIGVYFKPSATLPPPSKLETAEVVPIAMQHHLTDPV